MTAVGGPVNTATGVRTALHDRVDEARRVVGFFEMVAFLLSPARRRRPHSAYRRLRELAPLARTPFGVWIASSHEAVSTIIRNPHMGSDESKADLSMFEDSWLIRQMNRRGVRHEGPFIELFGDVMLFKDPPDHTRLRAPVGKAFTPRRVEQLTERVTVMTEELLDRLDPRGGMELMHELAYPLPARVICELLGVPEEDQALFVEHAPALATGLDPSPMRTQATLDAGDRACAAITAYLGPLLELRRRDPRDDMLSALVTSADEGDAELTDQELVATAMLLLIAGHETTANLIGNSLLALFHQPDQLARLRDEPEIEKSAVEELLRFEGPIQMMERIALDDIEVAGEHVPKGAIVIMCPAAANRDPAVFDDPERLDLGRQPNPHVGFGGGLHFCIGASLARMEARVILPMLLRRFPNLRLATDRPEWRSSFTIRGLERLPVAW